MKYTFFIVGLLLITFSIKPNADSERTQKSKKTVIVFRKKDQGIWNSETLKVVRHLAFFSLVLRGSCNCIGALGGPILAPRYGDEIFCAGLLSALVEFGLAYLIKVKNEDSETAEIIATEEGSIDNIIVTKQ